MLNFKTGFLVCLWSQSVTRQGTKNAMHSCHTIELPIGYAFEGFLQVSSDWTLLFLLFSSFWASSSKIIVMYVNAVWQHLLHQIYLTYYTQAHTIKRLSTPHGYRILIISTIWFTPSILKPKTGSRTKPHKYCISRICMSGLKLTWPVVQSLKILLLWVYSPIWNY